MTDELFPTEAAVHVSLEVLRGCSPEDFDGHTEFHRLTPARRLVWLDEAVAFITAARRAKTDPEPIAEV